ncbi:transcriptional regulator ATRX-like isoform X2 [Gambusia affinis]|uniref:transcriptional regulator ATRX-like isoform X2 n=1 Tax=Gambusia affinis TaxID=33528 RepID=UPI001CDC3099|nr:transcriptional regulator ATRX-like isoform X2 [Gambusia affinis]
MKSQTNHYSSAGGSKNFHSSSSKTFKSLGFVNEKDQQSKREAPLRAPQTSSSQSTSSPATSAGTPQLDKHGAVLTPAAVAKADHKVSAESDTAKSQLGPRVATSNLNQGCFKAETLKEGTESKEKQKKMDSNMRNHVKQGNDPLDSKHIATKELLVAIKEEKPLEKDEDSKVKLDQSMKTFSGEEGYTLPIKQESSDKKYETKIKESSSETGEKMVCKDSVPDESPIHTCVKETGRGANQDKSATVVRTIRQSGKDVYAEQKEIRKDGLGVSAQEKPLVKGFCLKINKNRVSESEDGQNSAKEQSLDKQSETQSKILSPEAGKRIREMICEDSLQVKSGTKTTARLANPEQTKEDNAATNKPTIPMRMTITEKDSLDGRMDNTPRKRNTPARDSQQQNEEKSEERSVKNIPPSTYEQKSRDILDVVEFNPYSSTSGQQTHSSLATLTETNQLEKKEANPTEDTVVKSELKVTTGRKSGKMDSGLVVDPSEKKLVSKAETRNDTTKKDLWVSDTVGSEVQTCSQSAAVNKQEHLGKDEGSAVKSSQRTKASKSEDGVNSSKKTETSQNQTETQSKDISGEIQTEEMAYKDSVQHKSGLRRCFRQTTELASQDKTNENKAARGGKLTESDSLVERKEDKTPTRRRKTPGRDPQQQNEEKTLEVSPKNVPSMTCNSRETQEEEKEAATPRRRGRPKKKVRPVPEKTLEVSPKNVPSMTCHSRETQEEEKEAATPRRRGRPKKKVRPVPVRTPTTEEKLNPDGKTLERLQHKQKMDLSGPEPKRSCSPFALVAAGVRCPP